MQGFQGPPGPPGYAGDEVSSFQITTYCVLHFDVSYALEIWGALQTVARSKPEAIEVVILKREMSPMFNLPFRD